MKRESGSGGKSLEEQRTESRVHGKEQVERVEEEESQ